MKKFLTKKNLIIIGIIAGIFIIGGGLFAYIKLQPKTIVGNNGQNFMQTVQQQDNQQEQQKGKVLEKKEAKEVHPIINCFGVLIGGTVDGEWKDLYNILPYIKGNEKYKLYSKNKLLKEISDTAENYKKCTDVPENTAIDYKLDFESLSITNSSENLDFGIAGEWNALIRPSRNLDNNSPEYTAAAKKLAQTNGISNPNIVIKETYGADIDGDNEEEKIIYATSLTEKEQQAVADGKATGIDGYSVVFMLDKANGVEQPTIIAQNNFKKDNYAGIYQIDGIADFNGDGKPEILSCFIDVSVTSVEGVAFPTYEIYEMDKNNFIKVLEYTDTIF